MESADLSCLIVAFSSFLSYLFLRYYRIHRRTRAKSPPGSSGWPLLGEYLAFFRSPAKFIEERVEKYKSHVFRTALLIQPVVIFAGPEGNKFLFSSENKNVVAWWPYSARKIFPRSILFFTSDKAYRSRRLIMKLFRPDDLNRYLGIMEEIAQSNMREEWEGKTVVKAFQASKLYSFSFSCRIMAGVEHPIQVKKLMDEFKVLLLGISRVPLNLPGMAFHRAIKAAEAIRGEFKSMISERKKANKEGASAEPVDLLSWLLVATDEEGEMMPEEEVLDNLLVYILAAHEGGTATIVMVMKFLAELPHVYNEVLREQQGVARLKKEKQSLDMEDIKKMKYTWNVVCEVMRLTPPTLGSFKVAIKDFTYAGYHIPKGTKMMWCPQSTNMDPRWFPDPEKFQPSRFEGKGPEPYTFTPFGGGPRICPGKDLAKLEILVFLHHVIKRFRWELASPEEEIVIQPIPTATQGLPLVLHPHPS